MVRTLNIEIDKSYGWEIDITDFKGSYEDYQDVADAPSSIGVCKEENGELIALYDPFVPKDEAIKDANEIEIFTEECKFVHKDNSFKGSFVDALIYIQNWYKEEFADE